MSVQVIVGGSVRTRRLGGSCVVVMLMVGADWAPSNRPSASQTIE